MHYAQKYFEAQMACREVAGRADLFKFRPFIKPSDTVMDVGCGGGFLLKNLECRRKIAVEINPWARKYVESQGIEAFEAVESVPAGVVDVAISHHSLEHMSSPFDALTRIKATLKVDSIVVVVVPHDRMSLDWRAGNRDMHLYTWNRMTLGNLFIAAGYSVERVDAIRHRWLPHSETVAPLLGEKGFHLACCLYARMLGHYQVRAVARPVK